MTTFVHPEYETPRLVRIHNRKLGIVRRIIQGAIVMYVALYALWLQRGYQEFAQVESSITVKIKGVTKSHLDNGSEEDHGEYDDIFVRSGLPSRISLYKYLLKVTGVCPICTLYDVES